MTDVIEPKPWGEILKQLREPVPENFVCKSDPTKGIYGDYIQGQVAVQFANDIFGAWGWTHEVVQPPTVIYSDPENTMVVFQCVVRATVTGLGVDVMTNFHDGVGVCVCTGPYDKKEKRRLPVKPEQIDTAAKGAETDAIKRALKNFGRRLGLDLYLDEKTWLALGEIHTTKYREDDEPEETAGSGEKDLSAEQDTVTIKHEGKTLTRPKNQVVGKSSGGAGIAKMFTTYLPGAPSFAGKGPYLKNHLKSHYGTEKVAELTFGQLNAIKLFGETGIRDKEYYPEENAQEELKVAVEATGTAVDAAVDITNFMREHEVPVSVLDALTKKYFPGPLGGAAAELIHRSMVAAFEAEGKVHDDGKPTASLDLLIKVGKSQMKPEDVTF